MELKLWAKKHHLLRHLGKLIGNCKVEYLSKLLVLHNDGLSFKDEIYSK